MSSRRRTKTPAEDGFLGSVSARSPGQKYFLKELLYNDITFCYGPAGTGKTHISAGVAAQLKRQGEIDRIIVTRPNVDSGTSIGYLPGGIDDKIGPYVTPIFDELGCYVERRLLNNWRASGELEIVPFSLMRGRTFNYSFVIVDEAQNATLDELRMALTRLGQFSKMSIVGDIKQSDLPVSRQGGLARCLNVLRNVEGIGVCELTDVDVIRHPLIPVLERLLR